MMRRIFISAVKGSTILFTAIVTVMVLIALFFTLQSIFISISPEEQIPSSLPASSELDSSQPAGQEGKLAIVIDDFGSSREGVKEMMSIERHLTFAIMPFLEYSRTDAEKAQQQGYEVIIHFAMEPNKGKKSWLGPRPILAGMQKEEISRIVQDAFDNVPHAIGANIHMGSKASSEESTMTAVLEGVRERALYFVDSRTAAHPVAKKIANAMGLICYDRDVFLDGQRSKELIKEQLRKAGEIARKKGYAVAIGHVGVEGGKKTAQAIAEMAKEFDEQRVQLVFVSELQEK